MQFKLSDFYNEKLRFGRVITLITDPTTGLLGYEPMYIRELIRKASMLKVFETRVGERYIHWKKRDPKDKVVRYIPISITEVISAVNTLLNKTRTVQIVSDDLRRLIRDTIGRGIRRGSKIPCLVMVRNPLPSFPETGALRYLPNAICVLTSRFEDDSRYRRRLFEKINKISTASNTGFKSIELLERATAEACSHVGAFAGSEIITTPITSPAPDILIPDKWVQIEVTSRNTNKVDGRYIRTKLDNLEEGYDLFLITPVPLTTDAVEEIPAVEVKIGGRKRLLTNELHVRYFPSFESVYAIADYRGMFSDGSIIEGGIDGRVIITNPEDAIIFHELGRLTRILDYKDLVNWFSRTIGHMFYLLRRNPVVVYRRCYIYAETIPIPYYSTMAKFLRNNLNMTNDEIRRMFRILSRIGWIKIRFNRIEFLHELS